MVAFAKSDLSNVIRNSFAFEVERRPLFGPNGESTGMYGLFRNDTNTLVSPTSVSDRYRPHQTADVLRLFDAAWEAFEGIGDVRCHFANGHYLTMTPSKETRLELFGTVDNIFPRLVVSAGYNGKPFQLELGWYRDLCKNLARLRQVQGVSTKIRHTLTISDRIDGVIESFSRVRDSWANVREKALAMEGITVDVPEIVTKAFGEPGDSQVAQRHAESRQDAIVGRILRERGQSGRNIGSALRATGWEAYNGIQGYVQHDIRRNSSPGMFDRMLLALNDPAVEIAEREILALAS